MTFGTDLFAVKSVVIGMRAETDPVIPCRMWATMGFSHQALPIGIDKMTCLAEGRIVTHLRRFPFRDHFKLLEKLSGSHEHLLGKTDIHYV
jgi:hypothetical protein